MRVVIVGAGVIGSTAALRAVQAGLDVVLLDAAKPGEGTSGASFSWLARFPHSAGSDDATERDLHLQVISSLRERTLDDLHALQAELDHSVIHECGTLTCASTGTAKEALEHAFAAARAKGWPIERLTRSEVSVLDPAVTISEQTAAYWEPDSAWVDVPSLIDQVLEKAISLGLSLRTMTRIASIRRDGNRVTGVQLADGEIVDADLVLLSAGASSAHLAATAGICVPLHVYPGLMVYASAEADSPLPKIIVKLNELSVRPNGESDVAMLWSSIPIDPAPGRNLTRPEDTLSAGASIIPSLQDARITATRVRLRPVPPQGPIVGPCPGVEGLYLMVSHGGVRWAATLATLAVDEIAGISPTGQLADFTSDRFFHLI